MKNVYNFSDCLYIMVKQTSPTRGAGCDTLNQKSKGAKRLKRDRREAHKGWNDTEELCFRDIIYCYRR